MVAGTTAPRCVGGVTVQAAEAVKLASSRRFEVQRVFSLAVVEEPRGRLSAFIRTPPTGSRQPP